MLWPHPLADNYTGSDVATSQQLSGLEIVIEDLFNF
jgi:hypothetical protein